MQEYLSLSRNEQKEVLKAASQQLGKTEFILEKDLWVCWVLEKLFKMPGAHPMAFKGGTSLSKVYNAINRFSEDVDVTLDYRFFKDGIDPFSPDISKTKIKKYSERLKNHVKAYSNDVVAPYFKKLTEQDIDVDDTGEKIWINYISVSGPKSQYLQARVLLELGGRNVIDPNEKHIITPYLVDVTKDLAYPKAEVVVLSPVRTFWEKATLIHVECNRNDIKQNFERLSRHWYDLARLSNQPHGKSALENRSLLEDVVKHKKVFFNSGYANYDACLQGAIKLVPEEPSLKSLKADYEAMLNSGMIGDEKISFEEVMNVVSGLQRAINSV